jgi:hexokinase
VFFVHNPFFFSFLFHKMISASSTRKATEYPMLQVNGTKEQQEAANEIHHQFSITTEGARAIVKQFTEEMQKGLDHDGATGKNKI